MPYLGILLAPIQNLTGKTVKFDFSLRASFIGVSKNHMVQSSTYKTPCSNESGSVRYLCP